jgi:hypothetical protein
MIISKKKILNIILAKICENLEFYIKLKIIKEMKKKKNLKKIKILN